MQNIKELPPEKENIKNKYSLLLKPDGYWYTQKENSHEQMIFKDAFFRKSDLIIILFRIYKLCFAKVNYFRRNLSKFEPYKYHYKHGFHKTELWDVEFFKHIASGYIIDLRYLQSITQIEKFRALIEELETFEQTTTMTIEEIKTEAQQFTSQNEEELNQKILELRRLNVGFLGCVAFLQYHLNIPLNDAKNKLMSMEAWSDKKEETDKMINLMLSDFDE